MSLKEWVSERLSKWKSECVSQWGRERECVLGSEWVSEWVEAKS